MCERKTEDPPQPLPEGLSDEQVKSLIALTRSVVLATAGEVLRDVLVAIEIDDRQQRLDAVAAILTRIDAAGQRERQGMN